MRVSCPCRLKKKEELIETSQYEISRVSLLCVQVLFCYEQFDELTLLHLREFDKKKLISVETDIVVDHYKEEKFEDSKPGLLLSHISSESPSRTAHTVVSVALTLLFYFLLHSL